MEGGLGLGMRNVGCGAEGCIWGCVFLGEGGGIPKP